MEVPKLAQMVLDYWKQKLDNPSIFSVGRTDRLREVARQRRCIEWASFCLGN